MDDFMQWAMNSLDQQQHNHAAAHPLYGGTGGSGDGGGITSAGAGGAAVFPSLQALRRQSTAAGGGVRDLTVQVDQHRASSWSASSCDSPGAAATAMDHDPTAAAGWSPHTARARTSRPMSWNFGAASASTQLTDASQLASPAAASAARGGQCMPTAGRRGSLLAATVSHGQGGGGTAASSSASASPSAGGPVQDHIIAERRRREKINQRFIELSTVIPGLKKMDKATILSDAVRYVKEQQEKLKELEDRNARIADSVVLVKRPCIATKPDGAATTGSSLPEIEARISESNVMVKIHCEDGKGVLVRLLSEVEGLHLSITHTNVIPFPACTVHITIMAKVDEGFSVAAEDIVGKLDAALHRRDS